jgi:hypothetical protein
MLSEHQDGTSLELHATAGRTTTPAAPAIGAFHKQINAVGSRVTCNPPPAGTDQDWLVLVPRDKYDQFAALLIADGWEVGGSVIPVDDDYRNPHEKFNSFTKGEDNVIATGSEEFHRRFLAATATAKALNLLEKRDRINLFQAVLYAAVCDPAFESVHRFDATELEIPF